MSSSSPGIGARPCKRSPTTPRPRLLSGVPTSVRTTPLGQRHAPGPREEYTRPVQDPDNELIGFVPGQQSTKVPGAPPGLLYPGDPCTPNAGLRFPHRVNFAPRFGFAWDIFGTAKLVVRGGFGIF